MSDELLGHGPEPDDAVLRQVATRLGTRAADRVDAAAVSRAVMERLRPPAVVSLTSRVRRQRPVWLRLAAALVVLAGAGLVARWFQPVRDSGPPFVADELTDLGAEQLTELLGSLDQALGGTTVPTENGLDDLDAEQLERVLRAMEG